MSHAVKDDIFIVTIALLSGDYLQKYYEYIL